MAQKQVDLSQDKFSCSLDQDTELEVIKRWNKMYVKIKHNKSNLTLPLETFSLIKDNMDVILLVAQFMQGLVGLNSVSVEDFDLSEQSNVMTS